VVDDKRPPDLDFWLDVGAAGTTATRTAGRFGRLLIVLSVYTVAFFLFIISFSLQLKSTFSALLHAIYHFLCIVGNQFYI
jgi:hypothetical protein